MRFDSMINETIPLNESVVDIPRDTLDPEVFQFFDNGQPPILRDGIKAQILKDIQTFSTIVPIVNFYIVGSILTNRWTQKCEIDVNIETDSEIIDNISVAEVLFNLRRLNGRLAIGTQHPINYYIIPGEANYENFDAIYDIANERWAKLPEQLNPDISSFITRFNETISSIDISTGEIRRNLIDLDELKEMGKENMEMVRYELQRKLDQLEQNIQYLTTIYDDILVLRRMAFDRTMTPEEIRYYGSKNNLPENVIYKLLEKYYYLKFIKQLDSLLDENNEFDIENLVNTSRVGREFRRA